MTCLISGEDYLARHPDFRLVGRDDYLKALSSILLRKTSNSVLLVGPSGVGLTALALGLQASKRDNPKAPFDILSKRLFWLDTDSLFASGNGESVRATFQADMALLERTDDSVLVIEDTRDFIEAARVSGNSHFVNALTLAVRGRKTQVILEVRDGDLEVVLKWHSDIRESYTLMDVKEPEGDHLFQIVHDVSNGLARHHAIAVSDVAIKAAIEVTTKYRDEDLGLSEAQPQRAITLIDRALAAYRLRAHETPPAIAAVEARIATAAESELPALRAERDRLSEQAQAQADRIAGFVSEMKRGETLLAKFENDLADARAKQAKQAAAAPAEKTAPVTPSSFASRISLGGAETDEIADIRRKMDMVRRELSANKTSYEALRAEINKDLLLGKEEVQVEFSRISGIAVDRLNQNMFGQLRLLKATLERRVFGQEDAILRIADAIKVGRVGRRNKGRPIPFLFLGPSGVGKTEVSKAIAEGLLGSEKALSRFDMAEYSEKHAVAKMIGAPPGYEGFQAGGILTNLMRKNRNRTLLMDEVEKAHPDTYDIFLSVLSDGVLTDNVGRTVSFEDSVMIFTSNIGQEHLLNADLTFEEAVRRATADLEKHFRPEFLNRFAGRQHILWFKRLQADSMIRIVRREINDLDAVYAEMGVRVQLPDADIPPFCEDFYDVKTGARGLPGHIQSNLESRIVNEILEYPDRRGVFDVSYSREAKAFDLAFKETANVA